MEGILRSHNDIISIKIPLCKSYRRSHGRPYGEAGPRGTIILLAYHSSKQMRLITGFIDPLSQNGTLSNNNQLIKKNIIPLFLWNRWMADKICHPEISTGNMAENK
uniref:Uncharacterized protein n=1 Tax=Micrurus lemniscatus lemniscatus TaxID=129467 RepID=A0A2D4HGB1_MICLE